MEISEIRMIYTLMILFPFPLVVVETSLMGKGRDKFDRLLDSSPENSMEKVPSSGARSTLDQLCCPTPPRLSPNKKLKAEQTKGSPKGKIKPKRVGTVGEKPARKFRRYPKCRLDTSGATASVFDRLNPTPLMQHQVRPALLPTPNPQPPTFRYERFGPLDKRAPPPGPEDYQSKRRRVLVDDDRQSESSDETRDLLRQLEEKRKREFELKTKVSELLKRVGALENENTALKGKVEKLKK